MVPKAVAISLDVEVFWDYAINSNVNGVVTKERKDNLEASRVAMGKCELSSKLSPCTLLATGDRIVFDPTALNWDPKINFNPRALSKAALITSDTGYDTFWVTNWFPGGDPAQFKGAIFVSQDGASWISTPNVTDTNTRASCQGISERRKPCFKFVQDGRIVATPSSALAGLRSPALHCEAMPRASCEAHFKAGCSKSGKYNIVSARKISEMSCNFFG